MKIAAGKFKGRNITAPLGIRPLSIRVKESCFNILKGEVEGKRVLDLFAGSGSLGIEAISQGAKEAHFVEIKKKCLKVIEKNLKSFTIVSEARTYQKDALSAIKDFSCYKEQFDLIFLDPPYNEGLLIKALQLLEEYAILAPSGYLVALCCQKDEFLEESSKFSLIVNRRYGQTRLLIYRKSDS